MDPWQVAGFSVLTLLQIVGFGVVLFINRQGKGEGRQQVQGETIASLRASITAMQENRAAEFTSMRRDLTDESSENKRKFIELEGRLERNLGKVDTVRNDLSRLETIVENLTKNVERMVERDDRQRSAPAAEPMPDLAMLRAIAFLMKSGGDLGKATGAGA